MMEPGLEGFRFFSDGHALIGRLWLAQAAGRQPTAVVLHGLPGIEQNHDIALALRTMGWNSLIFHYRGCWGSSGRYAIQTIPRDVGHALDALEQHPRVNSERLILIGHSLGGWAAVLVAADDPRVRAVVSIAGVSDPAGWQMPVEYAAGITPWLTDLSPEALVAQFSEAGETMRPVAVVDRIAPRPLLILHGNADTAVSVSHSERLAAGAGDNSELVIFPDADHGFSWHRPDLIDHLRRWVSAL